MTALYPYERNFIHPATRKWLCENGYEWRYEEQIKRGVQKRPDFIATHTATGETLIVECKASHLVVRGALRQVLEYQRLLEIPDAKMMVVIPEASIKPRIQKMFDDCGVKLLTLKPMSHYDFIFWEADCKGAGYWKRVYQREAPPFAETLNELANDAQMPLEEAVPYLMNQYLQDNGRINFKDITAVLYWLYTNNYTQVYDPANHRSVFVKGRKPMTDTHHPTVCPDCQLNIVPRLHVSVRSGFTCNHKIAEMTGDQLREIFPSAVQVFREIIRQSKVEGA